MGVEFRVDVAQLEVFGVIVEQHELDPLVHLLRLGIRVRVS